MRHRRFRPALLVLPLVGLLCITVLFVGRGVEGAPQTLAPNTTYPQVAPASAYQQPAEARKSGTDAVIARVDASSITQADFQEEVATVPQGLQSMNAMASTGSPSSTGVSKSYLKSFISLRERYGAQNVALAALIENRAVYELAVARGYEATNQEVAARVARDKSWVQSGKVKGIQSYINVIGPKVYWSTIYPALIRRSLTTDAFQEAVAPAQGSISQASAAWKKVQLQAVQQAKITLVDPSAVAPATVSSALQYLQAYYKLNQ